MPGQPTLREAAPFPVFAAFALLVGLYLLAGMACAAATSDWPPFWPPMNATLSFMEAFPEKSVIGVALLAGVFAIFLAFGLTAVGAWRLYRWSAARNNSKTEA